MLQKITTRNCVLGAKINFTTHVQQFILDGGTKMQLWDVKCCQQTESIYCLIKNFQLRLIRTFLIKQCHSLLHAEMADDKCHFHALSSINFPHFSL